MSFWTPPPPPPPPPSPYAALWPPSEESFAFLLALSLGMVGVLVLVYIRPTKGSFYATAAKEEKRARCAELQALTARTEAEKDANHTKTAEAPERLTELPESSRMLSLMYDHIDGVPTASYGISQSDPNTVACKALLDRAVRAEMRKAKVLSEASLRKPAELDETFFEKQGTSAKEVASYADGEALSGAIDKMKASP